MNLGKHQPLQWQPKIPCVCVFIVSSHTGSCQCTDWRILGVNDVSSFVEAVGFEVRFTSFHFSHLSWGFLLL